MTIPQVGPARDQYILSAVQNGDIAIAWGTVTSDVGGHHGEFRVFADALKIENVRVSVSAFLQQQIADLLSCTLLTAKLSDLCWAQRVATLPPFPQTADATMASTATMIRYSAAIDQALVAQGNPTGIVSTIGKNWILSNLLLQTNGQPVMKSSGHPAAVNYGWQFATPTFQGQAWDKCASGISNCRIIQGRGTAHDLLEEDYSQICQLVARSCFVDGVARDLNDILVDPTLSALVSSEGPLRTLRQPGVPLINPSIAATPPVGPGQPQNVSWVPGNEPVVAAAGATGLVAGLLFLAAGAAFGTMALADKVKF